MHGVPWLYIALATKYSEIALLIGFEDALTEIILNIKLKTNRIVYHRKFIVSCSFTAQ